MVIINKQKTPYDDKADLRIFANVDEASYLSPAPLRLCT